MDTIKNNVQLRKNQAPVALCSLRDAITKYVEDINRRLQAGLVVRQTPMAFEVYELEKPNALLRVSLTGESNIYYTQLVKRRNEMQSGVIYVRASQDGTPTILFSDFPSPNVEVSYHEASNRLLNSSF
jgi:tetrahydromethanopterin S-methyltransferase subunit F